MDNIDQSQEFSPQPKPHSSDCLDIIYSNKGLRFWEGGCTWTEGERTWVQLRKVFEKKERYLGYTREEIIAHERVHLLRKNFQEPVFEEILAYQTSSSPFRRFFGPVIRSSKETFFFLLLLCAAPFEPILYLGVLLLSGLAIGRLVRNQKIFARTKLNVIEIVGREKAFSILIRLKDKEILALSKMKREAIIDFLIDYKLSTINCGR